MRTRNCIDCESLKQALTSHTHKHTHFFLLRRCGLTQAMAYSFLRFLDYRQRRITLGRTPLDEWSARRRDLYGTTHNTHNKHPSPVGLTHTHTRARTHAHIQPIEFIVIITGYTVYIYIYIYIRSLIQISIKTMRYVKIHIPHMTVSVRIPAVVLVLLKLQMSDLILFPQVCLVLELRRNKKFLLVVNYLIVIVIVGRAVA
jgi:hypothetical protein